MLRLVRLGRSEVGHGGSAAVEVRLVR